jgi:N-glycosylase/DNA lyase
LREWLIAEVKGFGPKESSHFLRNVGFTDFAIIDFHIVDVLVRHGLIEKPKTVTKRRYLEIEELLRHIAKKADLNMAELDLYLWYMETGKVLK